jgi:peptidoglycan/xylan/chitin deacetylase (PgdA/CDA1 family)
MFDDGPHPQGTSAVLDLLEKAAVQAIFFLVGKQVERWPRLAAEIAPPVTRLRCTATAAVSSCARCHARRARISAARRR